MIVLKEVKINCKDCGNYLWRLTRVMYNATTKKEETKEEDPLCRRCKPQDYLEALQHAGKIVTITEDARQSRILADKEQEMKSKYDQKRSEKR